MVSGGRERERLHKHTCLSEDSYVELGLFFHLLCGLQRLNSVCQVYAVSAFYLLYHFDSSSE